MIIGTHIGRWVLWAAILASIGALGATLTAGWLGAGGVTNAAYTTAINTTNTGSTDLANAPAPFALSVADLIDGDFIAADALNAHIHRGDADVPSMPPSNRLQVEGAAQQDGTAFANYTTAAQRAAANDIPLLPSSPAVNDAIYFGCDNPCRSVTWDVDTAGVGTWAVTYEYWNGSNYTALVDVDDRTDAFKALGQHSVSWAMPRDWETITVTGTAVNSYWARARVSNFSAQTTQPLGSRIRYETGQWWQYINDLAVNNQDQSTLYFGGDGFAPATAHETFPGTDGIITADAAGLEPGNAYSIALKGRLDFTAAGATACIVCKTGVLTVTVSGTATTPHIGTSITGSGTGGGDTGVITVPDTGSQTIIVAANGTDAVTWVDGGGGIATYPVQTLTNNSNNWTWASGGGTDYFDWVRMDTAAPNIFVVSNSHSEFATGTLTNVSAYTAGLGLSN